MSCSLNSQQVHAVCISNKSSWTTPNEQLLEALVKTQEGPELWAPALAPTLAVMGMTKWDCGPEALESCYIKAFEKVPGIRDTQDLYMLVHFLVNLL